MIVIIRIISGTNSDTTSEFYERSFTVTVVDEVYGQLKIRFTGGTSIVLGGSLHYSKYNYLFS